MADSAPLSFAQLQIWLLDQISPETPAYNLPAAYRLTGPLDYKALEKSFTAIVRRHAVLRTTFASIDGEPRQLMHPPFKVKIRTVPLNNLAPEIREQQLQDLALQEARMPFDLAQLPLIRIVLFKLREFEHVLLINIHHIAADGLSLSVMLDELDQYYGIYTRASSDWPDELQTQYSEIATRERTEASAQNYEREIAFWRDQLNGVPSVLELPTDFQRAPIQSFDGSNAFFDIPKDLAVRLQELGARFGCTIFSTVLAAYQIFLYRYSLQEKIVVGTPFARRTTSRARQLVGNFLNMVPLPCDLSGDPTVAQVLQRTSKMSLRAFSKASIPFTVLVENVAFSRDASHSPIFQTMIEMLPAVRSRIGGLTIERYYFDLGVAQFDLSLHVCEELYGYACRFEFSSDLFNPDTVQRMSKNFLQILESIASDPSQTIGSIPILAESERSQILFDWNSTTVEYPKDRCLHELIEEVAGDNPNRTAIECDGNALTYFELNQRANELAHGLLKRGVERGQLVGVYLERSVDLVVALLGILKSGAAYVPLDPSFPADRLSYMMDDAAIRIIVTQSTLSNTLPPGDWQVFSMDGDFATWNSEDISNPRISLQPSDLAYTIYTSGSSGKPKGVMIEHRSLVNCLCAMQKDPGFSPSDVLVAVTTISFDIAALEIFLPLISGGKVVVASKGETRDGQMLADLLARSRATVLQATPSTWKLLLETSWSPDPEFKMLCGGEPLPRDLADRLVRWGGQLFNMYGPTETTIWSSVQAVRTTSGPIVLGPPIANTQFYVVDDHLQVVPLGVPGELLIGGDGLARGYRNRPELTEDRFITRRFADSETCVYRTGDTVKLRPDGRLEFLGRRDYQVKVRGFRIELEEIEHVLASHDAIREATATVWEVADGDKRLVAHYILHPGNGPTNTDLRNHVLKTLPEYMCPSFFVELSSFPLTPNGKIDRKALPKPVIAKASIAAISEKPESALEAKLLAIWQDILKRPIGLNDNFFDMGGHSLLAAQLFSRIEKDLGIRLPLATLFKHPTIRSLVQNIEVASEHSAWRPLVLIQEGDGRPPLFLVHGAEGNVILYRNLAQHLGAQQAVYGLQFPGLGGADTSAVTIEDLAATYCKEIRSVQPSGPYYIGGYCLGGTIAFEMARQFTLAGEPVALVALLESYNVKARPPISGLLAMINGMQNVIFQLGNLALSLSGGSAEFFVEKLRVEVSRFKIRCGSICSRITKKFATSQNDSRHATAKESNHRAQEKYDPEPYEGAVTLFRSARFFLGFKDPDYGWADLARQGMQVIEMANYPHGLLNEPFVHVLARELKQELTKRIV